MMTTELRAAVAACPDDTIIDIIRALVGGLIHGLADELTGNVDVITDRVVDAITEQLAAVIPDEPQEIPELPAPSPPSPPVDLVVRTANARASQDTVEHTCEICGRTGTRRFVPVASAEDNRWKCSPTATKCPGNRTFPPTPPAAPSDEPEPSDIPEKPIPAEVTPPVAKTAPAPTVDLDEAAASPAKPTPAYTARCQDCPRTWTLTGRILRMAVDTHELKSGHMVDIRDGADA